MSNMTVKGTKKLTSANSPVNAALFLVEQTVTDMLHTAEVVSINQAEPTGTGAAGYASATPLVCNIDPYHNTIEPSTIAKLPFFRPQAGKAAIIMDPQPGDKAVAVYMKRDSSNVQSGTNDPVPPASFRRFDQADGYLFNGFLGEAPELWLKLEMNLQTGRQKPLFA